MLTSISEITKLPLEINLLFIYLFILEPGITIANGQRKKQGKKEEYAKNTLTKRAKWGQTKHAKHIKKQTSMLSNKKGCPRTTHRHMHEHVGKRAKMRRGKKSQKGGTKQARQKYQLCIEWRERCVSSTPTLQRCIS